MTDLPPPSGPSLFERLIHARRPLVLLILMGALCWWVGSSAADNYRWQWYRVWRYIGTVEDGVFTPGPLLEGLAVTLELAASSLVLAVVAGGSVAFLRLSASPVARLMAGAFLGAVRNTPLLMQLFVVYFVVAPVFGLGPFASATLALGLFEGSYMAEIFRAGVARAAAHAMGGRFQSGHEYGHGLPLRHTAPGPAPRAAAPGGPSRFTDQRYLAGQRHSRGRHHHARPRDYHGYFSEL